MYPWKKAKKFYSVFIMVTVVYTNNPAKIAQTDLEILLEGSKVWNACTKCAAIFSNNVGRTLLLGLPEKQNG